MKKLAITFLLFSFTNTLLSQSDSSKIDYNILGARCETYPLFPGGEAKFFSFIKLVKCYPDSAKANEIEGKVYIQFVVKKTGELSDIKILRSPDTLLSKESIRIVKSMPKWTPGKNCKGDSVDVKIVLPIIFKIQENQIPKTLACWPTQASFPGGDEELFKYLAKNIKQSLLKNEQVIFKYHFEFVIEKDGTITNLKMRKNSNEDLYKHVALVFLNMPKWEPAKLNNRETVRSKMVLPISFYLSFSTPIGNLKARISTILHQK
jgi:TonB family protein